MALPPHVAGVVVQPPSQGLVPDRALGATVEEAAWEHGLKRLELGYEAEGFFNFRRRGTQDPNI
jgi:hypothetical protein